jgi:hypothetical protein
MGASQYPYGARSHQPQHPAMQFDASGSIAAAGARMLRTMSTPDMAAQLQQQQQQGGQQAQQQQQPSMASYMFGGEGIPGQVTPESSHLLPSDGHALSLLPLRKGLSAKACHAAPRMRPLRCHHAGCMQDRSTALRHFISALGTDP